jgi:hypothetical protein
MIPSSWFLQSYYREQLVTIHLFCQAVGRMLSKKAVAVATNRGLRDGSHHRFGGILRTDVILSEPRCTQTYSPANHVRRCLHLKWSHDVRLSLRALQQIAASMRDVGGILAALRVQSALRCRDRN